MHRAYGAFLLLASGFVATAQAQPGPLTLACKGTTTNSWTPDAKPEPISMGIIVNLSARTVQGFGVPGLNDYPIKITAANDATVMFEGQQNSGTSVASIWGTMDRVTGDLEAISMVSNSAPFTVISRTTYTLQCRPAQRIF
jgi:hypothetical protein